MRDSWPAISIVALALVAGCHTSSTLPGSGWFAKNPPTIVLEGTRAEMRAELMHHVPVGTSIEDAREVMRFNGFEIHDRAGAEPGALLFTRRRHASAELSYEWRVELRHDGARITGTDVAMLGFGPEETEAAAAGNAEPVAEQTGG